MKSMAKAILVGGFIVAAQAAVADGTAFPGSAQDGGLNIPVARTYADRHAGNAATNAVSAFPASAQDGGLNIPAASTYADRHANDPVRSVRSTPPAQIDNSAD